MPWVALSQLAVSFCRALKRDSVLWRNLAVVGTIWAVIDVALSQAPYPSAYTSDTLLARFWLKKVMKPDASNYLHEVYTQNIDKPLSRGLG